MARIAAIPEGATVKDDFPEPGNWHVRYQARATIPLKVMLSHEMQWLEAISMVVNRFAELERRREAT